MAYTLISHLASLEALEDNNVFIPLDHVLELSAQYEPADQHGCAALPGITSQACRDTFARQALTQFHLSCERLLADTHCGWSAAAFDGDRLAVTTL